MKNEFEYVWLKSAVENESSDGNSSVCLYMAQIPYTCHLHRQPSFSHPPATVFTSSISHPSSNHRPPDMPVNDQQPYDPQPRPFVGSVSNCQFCPTSLYALFQPWGTFMCCPHSIFSLVERQSIKAGAIKPSPRPHKVPCLMSPTMSPRISNVASGSNLSYTL